MYESNMKEPPLMRSQLVEPVLFKLSVYVLPVTVNCGAGSQLWPLNTVRLQQHSCNVCREPVA